MLMMLVSTRTHACSGGGGGTTDAHDCQMQFTHYTSHIQNNTNSNENSKAAIYTKPKLSHSKLWNQMQY